MTRGYSTSHSGPPSHTARQYGRILRDVKWGNEVIPYCFAFKRDDASRVLDTKPGEQTLATLRLMRDADPPDLLIFPSDRDKGKFTRVVYVPGSGRKRESMIVVRDAGDALTVRARGRARRYDARHRAR